MKIALIADSFSIRRGTGIARYSQKILNGLRKKGISIEPIYLELPQIPFGDAFKHLIRLPYKILKRCNDFDLFHATAPITALCFPFIQKPKIITYHDIISMLKKNSRVSLHVKIFSPLFFRIGKYCDKVIAVSTQTKEDLIKHLNIPENKIVVINSGIDNEFKPLNKIRLKDYYNIGYLGALNLRKKIDYLIKSFYILTRKYPELKVRVLIYGEGKHLHKLKKLTNAFNLSDYVEFKGFVPDEKLVEVYNSFDTFVLPSDWEGFGLPILEAQRCGVPVLIRKDAQIPQEASKYCLKVKSKEDMADKIFKLITNSYFRNNIVKQGLEHSKNFTWERTIEKTIKVYEEVIYKKPV